MDVVIWIFMCLILGTAACQSNETPAITAEEIVLNSADGSYGRHGRISFSIQHEGAHSFANPDGLLALRSAEGVYSAPDKTAANVKIIAPIYHRDIRYYQHW